ncbi:MBL fold metallo-hydrolase [Actinoplanes sp. RD1]|uniref:MBL fold metallo-hydrolase n=1 Tax=Actinoplanes sp. RD1 TaxID=3064538 RepID=UPI002740DD65|nr:MBL fold metallo-hydrolase [Actinoplanes sp. RD1]
MTETGTTASVTFIGNATTLLRLGDFTLLTDPAFGAAGTRVHLGYGAWTKRVKDPAMRLADLPRVDAVLLSHFHSDHFDRVASRGLPRDLQVVTTVQARRALRRRGFEAVQALPTWDVYEWTSARQRLRVTAVPAKHGPGAVDRLLPETMGSVLELEEDGRLRLRLYITGDTLFGPHLTAIPRRCGEIDAMLIHLGGTRLLGLLLTMDDRQGVATTELIRPGLTVPIHFNDYKVMKSTLSDYLARAREHGLEGVEPISRGATMSLPLRPVPA